MRKRVNVNGKKNRTNSGGKNGNRIGSSVVSYVDLIEIDPITKNQELAFDAWDNGYNLVLAGCAGTGKTFLGMYFALEDVLDPDTPYDQLIIVRSMVPTRDMGFLPGSKKRRKKLIQHLIFQSVINYLRIKLRIIKQLLKEKFDLNQHHLSVAQPGIMRLFWLMKCRT